MPSIVPPIPVTLDRPRHLLFDRRAVFAIEVELTRLWGAERTFFGAMRDLVAAVVEGEPGRLSINTLSILVWQGLLAEDPTLTLTTVQDAMPYMDPLATSQLVGKVLEAWQAASPALPPVPSDTGASQADPLDGSTGVPSGPSSALASV